MRIRTLFAMFAALLAAGGAPAAEYPARPIRVIVPFTAGSASDLLARMIGPKLLESWGQQVIVDNRPSAGGTVAGSIVATSAPDGHTLLLTSSAFAGSAALYGSKLPYDAVKDFQGVTLIALTAVMLVVSPTLGPKSTPDFLALAKQKPGQLNFGSSGIGSGTHYAGELFNLKAGVKAVHVPYKGTPEVITDVMSARMHYAMSPLLAAMPHVRTGRLIALGVTSPRRLPIAADIPSLGEAIPGFEYEGWFGVLAPSRAPRPLVTKLSQEIGRILELQELRDRIARDGSMAKPSTPAELDKRVRDEIVTRTKVFAAAGVKVE